MIRFCDYRSQALAPPCVPISGNLSSIVACNTKSDPGATKPDADRITVPISVQWDLLWAVICDIRPERIPGHNYVFVSHVLAFVSVLHAATITLSSSLALSDSWKVTNCWFLWRKALHPIAGKDMFYESAWHRELIEQWKPHINPCVELLLK